VKQDHEWENGSQGDEDRRYGENEQVDQGSRRIGGPETLVSTYKSAQCYNPEDKHRQERSSIHVLASDTLYL
jgi:hypothetical protein